MSPFFFGVVWMDIYVDGSGWNGKESRFAVALENGRNHIGRLAEPKTNNEMEYTALIHALENHAQSGDQILTDSQLLVGHLTKGWKVTKPHLFPLVQHSKALLAAKKATLEWMPREQNLAGHLLE